MRQPCFHRFRFHRFPALMAALTTTMAVALSGLVLSCSAQTGGQLGADVPLDTIQLPPGFSIEVVAQVPGARSLALGDQGTLFVGTRQADGPVFAVSGILEGKEPEVRLVDEHLNMPNGVAFRDGDLYVAEVSRILKYEGIEERLDDPPRPVLITDAYPTDRHHGWKYIAFGPDGMLYVPVGAPCNVCDEPPPYSSITRLDLDTGRFEVFATGIRNTVGFGWHPDTGELWFTNNGRDHMGDDLPPESLNRAPEPGLDFGFPFCHAGVPDPEYSPGGSCAEYAPPYVTMPAHVAPLGLTFITKDVLPEKYRKGVFFAEHGSWNRSTPIGYRISMVLPSTTQAEGQPRAEVFASGWLQDGDDWGRPVDILELPDGSLLVSDDKAGLIYRITHDGSTD